MIEKKKLKTKINSLRKLMEIKISREKNKTKKEQSS